MMKKYGAISNKHSSDSAMSYLRRSPRNHFSATSPPWSTAAMIGTM